ncbi:hypothetical protein GCM10011503_02920 [Henriciella pelagia]|uniref:Uncharacterized protein n=1 Tax=Henriciella pelagia TaxID=1977912 RepID=A0ABQ1J4T1_9PROT|nr:hypothetical protein GCM10011503_02920 [Henriciella pelagia]
MNRFDAAHILAPAEFQLQKPAISHFGRTRHFLGAVEHNGDGRLQRLWLWKAGKLPDGLSAKLGFEVPERTINRASGRAGTHFFLKCNAVETGFDLNLKRLDLGSDGGD